MTFSSRVEKSREAQREAGRLARRQLGPIQRAIYSRAIVQHIWHFFLARSQALRPRQIALYMPLTTEVTLSPLVELLNSAGVTCLWPRVVGPSHPLIFTTHPNGTAPSPLKEPLWAMVPGTAFDLFGGRLGFGGGYYDRTLATLSAFCVGVCFQSQLVDAIETRPHDISMHAIVTEVGLRPAIASVKPLK